MDQHVLRDAYTQHMRRDYHETGMQRDEVASVVRFTMHDAHFGFILYSDLTEETADAAIAAQVKHFHSLMYEFEWKLFDYDQPADLAQRLCDQGFVPEEAEAVMILSIDDAPDVLKQAPAGDIRKLTLDSLPDAQAVHQAVWGEETRLNLQELVEMRWQHDPASVEVFAAYVDGVPASYARIDYVQNNPFAGIYAGSTRPEYRNRGLYTALVAARLQSAKQRGCRYLTVDANPNTSMPILQKLGFVQIATSTPYVWSPPSTE